MQRQKIDLPPHDVRPKMATEESHFTLSQIVHHLAFPLLLCMEISFNLFGVIALVSTVGIFVVLTGKKILEGWALVTVIVSLVVLTIVAIIAIYRRKLSMKVQISKARPSADIKID